MPVFNGKTVPLGATHYTVSPGMRTRFMCRDPLLPSEWRGFYGEGWTAMETSLPINQLPYWALNPAEQEAHNKKTENRFLGFEITECPRKFFEYIATYGQATMKVDPGAGDHTVASLVRTSPLSVVWTSPFPKPTDSDKKLDAAIDKVKQATDDLVKARDAKPVKLCHLNIGDLFMVPETNMNVWQRSRWCGKLLQVITVPGENPAYTKGQFGLYGCQKSLRAMDMDTHEPLEMPCLSTLVWRC